MRVLSPEEKAYLSGTRDFTKAQQRYTRYRLKKKLRLLDESRDAAAASLPRLDNNDDGRRKNPPVLSDIGLATAATILLSQRLRT